MNWDEPLTRAELARKSGIKAPTLASWLDADPPLETIEIEGRQLHTWYQLMRFCDQHPTWRAVRAFRARRPPVEFHLPPGQEGAGEGSLATIREAVQAQLVAAVEAMQAAQVAVDSQRAQLEAVQRAWQAYDAAVLVAAGPAAQT